jgi:hypothetical protein
MATVTFNGPDNQTATFGSNPAAGSKVVVSIGSTFTETVTSVTDNAGNTYTLDATQANSTINHSVWIYRADNIALPGAGTLAVTIHTGGQGHTISGSVETRTGFAAGGPTQTNVTGLSTSASSSVNSGSVTPLAAGAWFAGVVATGGATNSAITLTSAGWTQQASFTDGTTYTPVASADKVDSGGPTATAATWTLTTAATWLTAIAVYDAAGALAVTTSSLSGGILGTPYSQTLAAAGGTTTGYTWTTISGSLPTGLSLSSGGVISGTPTVSGTFSFTVKVTDSGSHTATQPLSITIVVPFPEGALGLKAEIQLAGTWTDISQYLQHDAQDSSSHPAAVTITRGRQDELATSAVPSQATFKAWNADGRFCTRNPLGPYYPNLTRNTNIRFSVPAPSTYLRIPDISGGCRTPSSAGLQITGDIDVQLELQLDDYQSGTLSAFLAGKWAAFGTSNAWTLTLGSDGTLTFWWSTTGSDQPSATSTVPIPVGHQAVRATLQVSVAGNHVVTFYTSPSIAAASWTMLGPAITLSGTTSIFGSSTAPMFVSANAQAGKYYKLVVLSGIGGTVKASPDFTTATAGSSSMTDAQGNVWSPVGDAEFSNRDYRFFGQISSLPVTWDPTGNDVWANITASGVLRRLQQGNQPNVMSAMRRGVQYLPSSLKLAAYWPGEDGSNATSIASALGGPAMQILGAPQLASNSDFQCSLPLPAMNGGCFIGNVVVPAGFTWTDNVVRLLYEVPAGGDNNGALIIGMSCAGGHSGATPIIGANIAYGTGGTLNMTVYGPGPTAIYSTGNQAFGLVNGGRYRVSMEMKTNGTGTDVSIETLAVGAGLGLVFTHTLASTTVGAVTRIQAGSLSSPTNAAEGHFSVQGVWDTLFDVQGPLKAWIGEAAAVRFARLCSENSITSRVIGGPSRSVPMGYQTADTLMNLLQACEDTDRGQIYEPRDTFGLAYRTLASLINQPAIAVLDYNQDHMAPPLQPTDDDLYVINDVSVTNSSSQNGLTGSMAVASLNDGSAMSVGTIGDYANDYTVSVASDVQLQDEGGWILHTSTDNEERYPSVVVNLASEQPQVQAITASVRSTDIGSHLQIVNTPAFLPPGPVDLLAWGYTENLGDFCDEETFNTIPEPPYEVAVADDPVRGKASPVNATLHAGITSSAVSMQNDGELWTTSAGDFPINIMMDGAEIQVTNITGSSIPQTWTIVQGINGISKAHSTGAVITLATPAIAALT